MRKLCIIALAISLSGCAAAPYVSDAVNAAVVARRLGYDQCNAKFGGKQFKSSYALFDCIKDAEKVFAVSIKLKKMDVYKQYASQIARIAQDADTGGISNEERNKQLGEAMNAYFQRVHEEKLAADRLNNADYSALANGLAAFGTGYAQG